MEIWDHDEDKPREECGVFGIFNHPEAAVLTALGLHALQHRGQDACGIASYDAEKNLFHNERHRGLVGDAFTGSDMPQRLPGKISIGHNRYPTQGQPAIRNVQPIFADLQTGGFAIAHNGNLTNSLHLRRALVRKGAIFQSTMDTEVILHLLSRSERESTIDRFVDALSHIEGGYALVAMSRDLLIGARDPTGLRPLVLGDMDGSSVLASETCALDSIGADFVREVEPGEVVIISEAEGVQSLTPFQSRPSSPCLFEYIYFARPDSFMQGRSVYQARHRMGQRLAEESPVEADIVVPVPDGGVPAAIGYAEASGIPYQQGIIRNHYIGRTFIKPTQSDRRNSVSMKHAPNRHVLKDKRVVLIDDSIVRGTTSEKIVEMVRKAGAREVHFRSASPPIRYGDYYGINMPDEKDFMAHDASVEEMTRKLGVDSLAFLSVDGVYWAVGDVERDPENPQFADHYFTGKYPTPLVDRDREEVSRDLQLSLLDD